MVLTERNRHNTELRLCLRLQISEGGLPQTDHVIQELEFL